MPNHESIVAGAKAGRVEKQIVLPWSKAFEISMKGLRIRFWRSMLTIASIILAIAFLMSILMNSALEKALRPVDRYEQEMRAELAELTRQEQAAGGEERQTLERKIAEVQKRLEGLSRLKVKLQRKGILVAETEVEGLELLTEQEQEVRTSPVLRALGLEEITTKQWWLIILALMVCTVGIVNSMLMSVTERFREIGTMKCLGALDSFVIKLFLIESSLQGMMGTALGLLLGFVLTLLWSLMAFGMWVIYYFPGLQIAKFALLAFLMGSILSIAGAIAPAFKAASMQPVDAMRTEE